MPNVISRMRKFEVGDYINLKREVYGQVHSAQGEVTAKDYRSKTVCIRGHGWIALDPLTKITLVPMGSTPIYLGDDEQTDPVAYVTPPEAPASNYFYPSPVAAPSPKRFVPVTLAHRSHLNPHANTDQMDAYIKAEEKVVRREISAKFRNWPICKEHGVEVHLGWSLGQWTEKNNVTWSLKCEKCGEK